MGTAVFDGPFAPIVQVVEAPNTKLHFPQAGNSDCVWASPLPIKGVAFYGVPGEGKYTKYSRTCESFVCDKISRYLLLLIYCESYAFTVKISNKCQHLAPCGATDADA